MQERVEALEAQLAEREQLVAALTERLEQAAEQLDRLHRTGADRAVRAGVPGIPAELVAQQQKLTEDLQRAVEQWEALQPGAFFGRLESELGQLNDLVRRLEPGNEQGSFSSFASRAEARPGFTGSVPEQQGRAPRGSGESPRSIFEFMKASQQADSGDAEPAAPPADIEVAPSTLTAPAPQVELPPLDDPPPAVDLAQATAEELGQACNERDAYIAYLVQRLRQVQSGGYVPKSWAGLENVPEEQRSRLESLEHRLQETLRLAEVELSLQRARLAREELRIRMLDEQMQKDIKRAARDASDQSDDNGDSKGDQGGSRWKRMLGRRGGDA